jgi:hypothetical protein
LLESGRYERNRPQVPVSGDLNDIEPAHQKESPGENQHQRERDLAWIKESHCGTSITIVMSRGAELSRFSANGGLLPANAACGGHSAHIYAFMLSLTSA